MKKHLLLLVMVYIVCLVVLSFSEGVSFAFSSNLNPQYFEKLTTDQKLQYFNRLGEREKEEVLNRLSPQDRELLQKSHGKTGTSEILEPQKAAEEVVNAPNGRSSIERIISGEFPTEVSRELKQYGYDFFRKSGASFTELRNVPVGSDYVIGPGDAITMILWGRIDGTFDLEVDSEGMLYLPEIGSLHAAGLSFGELKKQIKRKMEAITGVNASVSMGRLRTIDVFVVGEALRPATYSISSISTVISALYASGGPSKHGSLRNIQVLRNGDTVSLDLYDFFTKGVKRNDIRLKNGDTIFIPVLGPVVGVAGAVKRPAIYEMKGEQTIQEIIELAGGILPTGEIQNVVIERVEGQKRRIVKSFNLSRSSAETGEHLNTMIRDFDVIKIYPLHDSVRQVVYLEGHVKYPREYELKPGMNLLNIIPSYDALLPEPYLRRAEIIRLIPPDYHPELIQFNLGELLDGDPSENLALKDRDRVIVYNMLEKKDLSEVTIEGAVRIPGTYKLYKGMTVKDLIFQAGNISGNAYMDTASLTRVIPGLEETLIKDFTFSPEKALAGVPSDNIILKKDDSIRIREIPKYNQALEQKVFLEGEFLFPGEYTFKAGDKLTDVIEKAGGFTSQAYFFGASFHRESVKMLQAKRLKEYVDKMEEDILLMGSKEAAQAIDDDEAALLKQSLLSRKSLVEKLKTAEPTGRMVIQLDKVMDDPSSEANLELRSGDHLVVGKRPDIINIMGEVYNPTAILAESEKTVAYYLKAVGGATPNADTKQVYVVKADGSVVSKTQERFFGMASWDASNNRWVMGFESTKLHPGDTIVVPTKVEVYPWLKTTKDFTQILYQIAVGAGVIVAAF